MSPKRAERAGKWFRGKPQQAHIAMQMRATYEQEVEEVEDVEEV
jgi:hypothetical protein